ncbi:RNA pseudouridine synthase 7-like [Hibiscus syriacus]|uniref:RNA pseudouridine synthase 7-like n=1 Tax=Hibiscus syriacus TaxID=106335 RepID=UPI0019223627|nr:RNA pseudouridine synthase 7-like [Hibiscus syriacus]
MEITWQTPPHASQKQDYVLYSGKLRLVLSNVDGYKWMERMYLFPTLLNDPRRLATSYTGSSHIAFNHESPVMGWDVEILQSEPDVLTVCEPASVPVHPCDQYRKNTVLGILQAEHGLAPLYRSKSSTIWCKYFTKQYAAKVFGVFPEGEQVVDSNVDYNAREGRSTAELGICNGDTTLKGKAARTKFTRISTNGTHSIVLCEPVTGRTHQISVHLQCMGHPIANDMLYLSDNVVDRCTLGTTANIAAALSGSSPETSCENHNEEYKYCNEDFSIDPMCTHCPNLAPDG